MRAIGGYLELEQLINDEYHKNAIALNSARNAFVYIAKSQNISKVYLPYYLCDSVYEVCKRENINFEFYHIDKCFMPIFDKSLKENEYLYIVNYFGQIDDEKVRDFKNKYGNIIVDNVQAFFDRSIDGVYTIYSCRKFFGVPDGAYLSGVIEKLDIDTDKSKHRIKHLLGRFEDDDASGYYADFLENDEMFADLPLRYMSKLTHNILGAVNYIDVIRKRNANWNVLHSALGEINKLNLITPNAPYMYPFYCNNASHIRKKLVENKIFIPTLWPNVMNFDKCELEKDYTQNILPLPVDQRYDAHDMRIIIEEIKNIIKDDNLCTNI